MTTPCKHCGTPCPAGAAFCCVGCEAVYHALHEGGLQNFYALRAGASQPVPEPTSRGFTPDFETLDDGSVCATVGVDGTHCAGCVWLVEKMPVLVDGVVDARLNLGRGRLQVRWQPEQSDFGAIDQWLRKFGYSAYPLDEGRGEAQRLAERDALVRVGISWVLAANVMLLAIALYSGLDASDGGLWTAARWLAMLLSGASLGYGGREFFRRAFASVRARSRISVDLPVALGLGVGWIYSATNTVLGTGEVWFDSVAVLIAALLSARWLHTRGLRVASDAMDRLSAVLPRTARRQVEGGYEEVDAASLRPADLVEVRTGDAVPADATIMEGLGALDRSLLTGESEPIAASAGDRVWAGETNTRGRFVARVDAVGEASRFGQLIRFIATDQGPRAATVQLADRLAGWFVLLILGGAVVSAVLAAVFAPTELVPRVVALLVVSCPCALGMATPLAFTVALGRAAKAGIFVRGDGVFETLRRVDTIVLDKTGTLTRGDLRVLSIDGDASAMRLAAAAERHSTHPIAAAFVTYDEGAVVTSFDERPGIGVSAVVDGHDVRLSAAGTGLALEVDGDVRATIQLGDAIRPEARAVLAGLRERNIDVWLASGDHAEAVEEVAAQVGIARDRRLARQTPEDKLALIRRLQREGRVVAMVGDGVNDAAALREASVGIAMHGGVELNAVAGNVQLGRAGLRPIEHLFEIADTALGAVHRNLVFSATYNVLAIGAAIAGLVTPLLAAVAMPLSSVTVVASSLLGSRTLARTVQTRASKKPLTTVPLVGSEVT